MMVMAMMVSVSCAPRPDVAPPTTAPSGGVVAVFRGQQLKTRDVHQLQGLIVGTLMEEFALASRFDATDKEVKQYHAWSKEMNKEQRANFEQHREKLRSELKEPDLDEKKRAEREKELAVIENVLTKSEPPAEEPDETDRRIARAMIVQWKLNNALYRRYGGRVIFQQAGAEPIDAYRDFLKEHEKQGSFKILDPQIRSEFWRYFTDDSMHSFFRNEVGQIIMTTPPWLLTDEQKKRIRRED
jgi:hypothetical protein